MVLKYIKKLFSLGKSAAPDPDKAPPPALSAGSGGHQPLVVRRPIPIQLIDPDVVNLINRLTRYGHTAYIVGGGVRDLLLGVTPKDFDIGVSAQPEDVKRLFRNCRIIGRRFRLAHIFFQSKIIEVATFRAHIAVDETSDGRDILIKSDNVFGTPETDALRRDFTINALFYEPETGRVIDFVDGLADLDAHLLRTIGDPNIRFREDPIRILRALRLAGRLNFKIHDATLRAIREHRHEVLKAAIPRVLEDILRMLRGGGAEGGFRGMRDTGVLEVVLPELARAIAREEAGGKISTLWKALHAIDLATTRGTEFSDSTLIAAALYPCSRPSLQSSGQGDRGGKPLMEAIDAALGPMEVRLNIPRREREQVRHLLLAQMRFTEGRQGGHRFSPAQYIARPFFPEAFDLFEILVAANGEHREELAYWREQIQAYAREHGGRLPAREADDAARSGREGRGGRDGRGERGTPDGRSGRGGRGGERGGRSSRGGDRQGRGQGQDRGGQDSGARQHRGDRGQRAPRGGAAGEPASRPGPPQPLFAEGPDRPDLTEEDVALIYGVVMPGEGSSIDMAPASAPRPERQAAAAGAPEPGKRRRRRGGRRHRRGQDGAPDQGGQGGSADGGGVKPDDGAAD